MYETFKIEREISIIFNDAERNDLENWGNFYLDLEKDLIPKTKEQKHFQDLFRNKDVDDIAERDCSSSHEKVWWKYRKRCKILPSLKNLKYKLDDDTFYDREMYQDKAMRGYNG
jgi:uncharacterized protein YifE (UPF0438 family)|tara:strand:+ start:262 stop:603 length:342 start_codon:yes stop_codon:yes gene_type:complete